jgi:hypothetical protein
VRYFLKSSGIFPTGDYTPKQAFDSEIEEFNDLGAEPPLQDLRLDWSFKATRWNNAVYSALAKELRRAIKANELPPIRWKHVQDIADGKNRMEFLETRVRKTIENQKGKVQKAHERALLSDSQSPTPDIGSTAAANRRASRRHGVRLCHLLIHPLNTYNFDDIASRHSNAGNESCTAEHSRRASAIKLVLFFENSA